MGTHIQLTASDGHAFRAYFAQPSTPAMSSVVIIQEIFGVNSHIRSIVDAYASQGFSAMAPDLFDRVQPGIELKYNSADSSRGMQIATQVGFEKALLDVAAAITQASQGTPPKKVGVVGFCWGGTLAWLAATRLHPTVSVAYYGGNIFKYLSEQPRCPAMLHFGAKDKHISTSDIQKIQRAFPNLPVFVYDDAGHGFNCDQRPGYSPKAAIQARQRTLSFLHSHLDSHAAVGI
jgi:carboxymethylenebutenolidase